MIPEAECRQSKLREDVLEANKYAVNVMDEFKLDLQPNTMVDCSKISTDELITRAKSFKNYVDEYYSLLYQNIVNNSTQLSQQ